jgi:hypothetical protein
VILRGEIHIITDPRPDGGGPGPLRAWAAAVTASPRLHRGRLRRPSTPNSWPACGGRCRCAGRGPRPVWSRAGARAGQSAPGSDHAGERLQQLVKLELAHHAEHRGDMAVGQRADHRERVLQARPTVVLALSTWPRASIRWWGQGQILARMRFLTLPSSRKASRRRTAGGELRLGTMATYMPTV